MSKLIIEGGKKLEGEIFVHGAKNAVLPILAAALLNAGNNVIYGCPRLKDVHASIEILKHLGCAVSWEGDALIINSQNLTTCCIPDELMREMRSSVIFLGTILARCHKAIISYPGG